MRLINSSFEIVGGNFDGMLERIEAAGRTCYKSEDRITPGSAERFVETIIASGHHSVLEHVSISVRIICDRGVSHEIVRHRLASYSQESTRYCNYGKEKFGCEITFIDARPHLPSAVHECWLGMLMDAESDYFVLLEKGVSPQMARSVLPNALKTEIVMTCNVREWRHFFALRTSEKAHPQMREIAQPMLTEFRSRVSVLFDDVGISTEIDKEGAT